MPRAIVGALLVVVFATLCAWHVYWAAGGRRGAKNAVPEVGGKPTLNPGPTATLVVAALLAAAAAVVAMRSGLVPGEGALPRLVRLSTWSLAAVFALRAVGDFRTIGFFKAVRGTGFARYDTALYSPLCLAIAAGSAFVAAT
jgi:hypothetical protein